MTLDQTSFCQKLYMAADARLALTKELGEVFDVELAVLKKPEEAKAGRFPGGPQAPHGIVKAVHDRPHHERLIKICLYVFKAELPADASGNFN
jgi:hypothetical protein